MIDPYLALECENVLILSDANAEAGFIKILDVFRFDVALCHCGLELLESDLNVCKIVVRGAPRSSKASATCVGGYLVCREVISSASACSRASEVDF